MKITATILKKSDDIHNATQKPDVSHFEVGSFVLAAQRTQPETRMHTLWRGPFRVLSNKKGEYTLLNLITQKDVRYHMSQLKPFLFDPLHTDPSDVARRDYLEFFIDVTRTRCTDPYARTVRVEDDPIHTIPSHDTCYVYL